MACDEKLYHKSAGPHIKEKFYSIHAPSSLELYGNGVQNQDVGLVKSNAYSEQSSLTECTLVFISNAHYVPSQSNNPALTFLYLTEKCIYCF